jgi:hypothetical protein
MHWAGCRGLTPELDCDKGGKIMDTDPLDEAIGHLQRSYLEYMENLKAVLDFGDASIERLVVALNHRHANPIAKALGLMMHSPLAEQAFPKLLSWLVTQSPLYPDVLEALVRAGGKPAPQVLVLIRDYAEKNDDEAVRHLFDLACRFPNEVLPKVVWVAKDLLAHSNPHIRECAADALWRIGLPHGLQAKVKLESVSREDSKEHVKNAAREALERLGGS